MRVLHGAALSVLLLVAIAHAQQTTRTDPGDGEHAPFSSFLNPKRWLSHSVCCSVRPPPSRRRSNQLVCSLHMFQLQSRSLHVHVAFAQPHTRVTSHVRFFFSSSMLPLGRQISVERLNGDVDAFLMLLLFVSQRRR